MAAARVASVGTAVRRCSPSLSSVPSVPSAPGRRSDGAAGVRAATVASAASAASGGASGGSHDTDEHYYHRSNSANGEVQRHNPREQQGQRNNDTREPRENGSRSGQGNTDSEHVGMMAASATTDSVTSGARHLPRRHEQHHNQSADGGENAVHVDTLHASSAAPVAELGASSAAVQAVTAKAVSLTASSSSVRSLAAPATPSGNNSTRTSAARRSRSPSPETPCAICLDSITDRCLLETCFHAFCRDCIQTWAAVSRLCPLCKTPFTALVYDIRSETVFRVQQLSPLRPPRPPRNAISHERAARTRLMPASRRQAPVVAAAAPWRRSGVSYAASPVERRRIVYAARLHVEAEYDANVRSHLRSLAPRTALSVTNRQRLQPWLEREVEALVGLRHRDFVLTFVQGLLRRVDLRERALLVDQLRPFFFEQAEHFWHELIHFAQSPLSMAAYDAHARYPDRAGLLPPLVTPSSIAAVAAAGAATAQSAVVRAANSAEAESAASRGMERANAAAHNASAALSRTTAAAHSPGALVTGAALETNESRQMARRATALRRSRWDTPSPEPPEGRRSPHRLAAVAAEARREQHCRTQPVTLADRAGSPVLLREVDSRSGKSRRRSGERDRDRSGDRDGDSDRDRDARRRDRRERRDRRDQCDGRRRGDQETRTDNRGDRSRGVCDAGRISRISRDGSESESAAQPVSALEEEVAALQREVESQQRRLLQLMSARTERRTVARHDR